MNCPKTSKIRERENIFPCRVETRPDDIAEVVGDAPAEAVVGQISGRARGKNQGGLDQEVQSRCALQSLNKILASSPKLACLKESEDPGTPTVENRVMIRHKETPVP